MITERFPLGKFPRPSPTVERRPVLAPPATTTAPGADPGGRDTRSARTRPRAVPTTTDRGIILCHSLPRSISTRSSAADPSGGSRPCATGPRAPSSAPTG
ncbi:hypothetical protein [Ornithinimicrobium kibberense]|uniref:hypothetical protein n=1 Tax=Ornithinimicrobium kibberense TaxID=282060 RepID=UPI00360D9BD3